MSEEDPSPVAAKGRQTKAPKLGEYKPRGRPPGPPKPPKEKKPRGRPKGSGTGERNRPTHAPFVKLVQNALENMYEHGGVSSVAVTKYIMGVEPECQDKVKVRKSVTTALKRLVAMNVLEATAARGNAKFRKVGEKSRGRPKLTEGEKPKKVKSSEGKRAKKAASPAKKALVVKLKMTPKKAKAATGSPKKRGRPKKADASPKKAKAPASGTPKKRGRPKKS